ncbi:hypothetical protein, partial [Mesorhizobium sp. M7A.T.Ca.US.000.02.1.1]|uniref:hypothetical protein n=1 Tax=Mesorhizobium sp. M7A.T.Ca.US.000.02.1.1 TaxID=2496792 RepID=UPI0019D4BCBA
ICLLKLLPRSRPQRCASLATGARIPSPHGIFVKDFDARKAREAFFVTANCLQVREAGARAFSCI